MSPSLFLAGAGDEFANATAQLPQAVTQSGLCPIEVVLDSDDHDAARDRLAANIHQMFQNQENRRFAYGLVITETEITVYMFDIPAQWPHSLVITIESRNSFGL